MLWRFRSRELCGGTPVTFGPVLLTTLLNPKAMVIAFLLLPAQAGLLELLPWLGVIGLQIVTAGAAWVTFGATFGRGVRRLRHPDPVTRLGAFTPVAVTGLTWVQSFWSA